MRKIFEIGTTSTDEFYGNLNLCSKKCEKWTPLLFHYEASKPAGSLFGIAVNKIEGVAREKLFWKATKHRNLCDGRFELLLKKCILVPLFPFSIQIE